MSELSAAIRAESLATRLASLIEARENSIASGNAEWRQYHEDRIRELAAELPSGSGFDNGSGVNLDLSTANKIVIETSFHHMNDGGSYDGWTDHTVVVTPAFGGVNIRVTGRDRNDIKYYIGEMFHYAMLTEGGAR